MAKKLIYNILLTIGLIAMVYTSVASFKNEQYEIMIVALAIVGLLSFLKIKLLKQVRGITKDNKE